MLFLQLFCKSQIISELKKNKNKNLIGRAYNFLHLFADVTLPRLKAFIPQLLSRLHIEALLHGNITKQVGDRDFSNLLWIIATEIFPYLRLLTTTVCLCTH